MNMKNDDNTKKKKNGTGIKFKVQQKLKVSGKEYVTSKGKTVPAKKQPQLEMVCKCYNEGCKKIKGEEKKKLFNNFYSLDLNAQGSFCMSHIHLGGVKRRRNGQYTDPRESRRQSTVYYTLPDGSGSVVNVCKKTFMNVLSLGKKKIEVPITKKKSGDIAYTDKRGTHGNHRKVYTKEDRNHIISHINSVPKDESHYSREKSSKLYLSPDLNIHRLAKAFNKKYPNNQVLYKYYCRVFKKEFPNLSFRRPRTDTCKTCDRHASVIKMDKNASPAVSLELQLHHRKAEKAQTHLKEDCASSQQPGGEICTITIDLEKVLFVPTLTHSDMYYMRQLSVYNFSVHIADTNEAFMCVWNETEGSRGSNEIMSCLLKVLNSNVTEKEKLNIWCDNCTGQNKNRVAIFLMLFLTSIGLFTEITMKFLVSGHSYLPNDRHCAQIERRRRLKKCFVPEDIEQLIRDTRSIQPYKVVKIEPRHFLNLQQAADSLISTTKLSILTLSQIRATKDNPGYVFFKKSHSDLEGWQKIRVLKKNISEDEIKNVQIVGQESTPELNAAKKQNLRAMIPYLHLPEHREFYQKLTV